MENPDEFRSAVIESEEVFRSQFDPSSELYHNGDPTPVPLGGERVPDSMPTAYDPNGYQQDTPMDPTYFYLTDARNILLEFKKCLTQACSNVESLFRARQFKEQLKRDLETQKRHTILLQSLEILQDLGLQLGQYSGVIPDYSGFIIEVLENSLIEYTTKEEYGEYMRAMTILTQKVFKDSQDLLARMKVIKSNS